MNYVTNPSQTFKQFVSTKKVTRTKSGELIKRIQTDEVFPDYFSHWKEVKEFLYPDTKSTDLPNCARALWWEYVRAMNKAIIINNG